MFGIDPKVFKRFKPNKMIVKNMNMTNYILSTNYKDQELALDFCSFLLRYHKDIDYIDFSEDEFVVQKIRRAEIYRSWADIEDLANGYETLNNNFEKHRAVTSNAFQEIVKLVEKVKGECISIASTAQTGANDGEFRKEISQLKNQVSSLQTQLQSSSNDSKRYQTNFSTLQNDLSRLHDQQLSLDNNMKLLAEGTLNLTEKDKQFTTKIETLRKDITNLSSQIDSRVDTKLQALERGFLSTNTTIEGQMEFISKQQKDSYNLLESKLKSLIDDKALETKKLNQDAIIKSVETLKKDYESLIKQLGSTTQEALLRLKQDVIGSTTQNKREQDEKIWQNKTELEDQFKSLKMGYTEDLRLIKEELKAKITDTEQRTHKEFSKLLDDTTQAIEDSINGNLVRQMKELDQALQDVTNKTHSHESTLQVQVEKSSKMEDSLTDHIDLIESLNRKLDKQNDTIEENKVMIIEKLGIFEAGVISELKEATSHFSFKAYEESFRKIEQDMDTFYKELLKIREDFDNKNKDLGDWKSKMGNDLVAFYKKYDSHFIESNTMSKTDKENLNAVINELTENIAKNRQSIQLLAKESSIYQSQIQQCMEKNDETVQELHKGFANVNKQIQDIYVQMRKLSSDVFDQIKTIKASTEVQQVIERERENVRLAMDAVSKDINRRIEEQQQQVQQVRQQIHLGLDTMKDSHTGMHDLITKMKTDFKSKLDQAQQQALMQAQMAGQSSVNSDEINKRFAMLMQDVKTLSQVTQKFIDEHLTDKIMVIRSKYKGFEKKLDSLEWLSRYANFFSPENVYIMLSTFKEIYNGPDVNYRNAYIQAEHGSDAIVFITNAIKKEIQSLMQNSNVQQSMIFGKNLTGEKGVVQSTDTKIAFLMNILEPLLVNDMNNDRAVQNGLLEMLVQLLRTQETSRQQPIQLKPYIKFALRCLTSAIRTEVAVNRFYTIDGGIQKVLEILELVEDQELIANSCKIARICLRDDGIYDKLVGQYPSLANLIIEKMAKWNTSIPIIQESSSAVRNYVRKPEYVKMMRTESVDVLVGLARDPRFDKIKPVIGQALKMMSRVPEFDNRIKQQRAGDLLV